MNTDDEFTPQPFVPIDLSPELQRESELRDLKWMQENDPTQRYEIKNVMYEMNLRMAQYIEQFKSYSLEFLLEQTMRDFQEYLLIKQKVIRLKTEPVALLRDGFKKIYVNPVVVRSDYDDGGVVIFIHDLSEVNKE